MKLCYYKLPNGEQNFGDSLNLWLWNKLIPGILDNNESVAFIGIGSLINKGKRSIDFDALSQRQN